jgi:hypothetical protein
VLIAVSGILLLAASLWELKARFAVFTMPLLLLATPFYLILAVWQYADVPVALFILSTIAVICIHWEKEAQRARMLASLTGSADSSDPCLKN